jgi:RHS repeat-associated protein
VSYRYNGDGLITERSTGGKTTRYYYDDRGLLVAEGTVSSAGTVQITVGYVYDATGKLTARQMAAGESQLQSYVTNGHGDVTEIRDASGNVLNRYTYDIWGNAETTEETVPNVLRYAGEYWDEVTGLQYLRARWYDPSTARFINEYKVEGELTNPLSLNLYTYVENNPLIYTDPSGEAKRGEKNALEGLGSGSGSASGSAGMGRSSGGGFGGGGSRGGSGSSSSKPSTSNNGQSNNGIGKAVSIQRVGQWMSQSEYKAFVKTGTIPRTNVLTKGKGGYEKQANKGDVYVEFDIDSSLLILKDAELGWSLVKSKNQMQIKLAEKKGQPLPDPVGNNIKIVDIKK